MRRAVPVTKRPSSDASMAMTDATTSGGANPSATMGDIFENSDQSASDGSIPGVVSVMPLWMLPGATAVTRMPRLPYSSASEWVMASIPPLLAA